MRGRYISLLSFLATLALAAADEDKCADITGSCISYGAGGEVEHCTLNGAYVERTTCYYKLCNNGRFTEGYTCRHGCHQNQTCLVFYSSSDTWENARKRCNQYYGYDLVDGDEVDPLYTSRCGGSYYYTYWTGGSSSSKSSPFKWTNGKLVDQNITSQVASQRETIDGAACLTVKRDRSSYGYTWGVSACSTSRSFICAPICKSLMCRYNGKSYNIGEVVWESPTCQCTKLICEADGEVHMVQKEKPCCLYHDRPYGNNEVVVTDRCSQILCHNGTLVSVPHCPTNFTFLSYNGVGSCYHVSDETHSYPNASGYCQNLDSNLAVVSSEGENHALEDHLFYNQLHGGCKNGWLGAAVGARSTVVGSTSNDFYTYITWQSGILSGMPVESIYDDYCDSTHCSQGVTDVNLGITYTGSQVTNNYCWNCTRGSQMKNAICETCITCEHQHSEVCLYCGKIYDNGQIIKEEIATAPCYEMICNKGKVQKKTIACPLLVLDGDVPK